MDPSFRAVIALSKSVLIPQKGNQPFVWCLEVNLDWDDFSFPCFIGGAF